METIININKYIEDPHIYYLCNLQLLNYTYQDIMYMKPKVGIELMQVFYWNIYYLSFVGYLTMINKFYKAWV